MLACQTAQDAIAQNLANANTTGYKQVIPDYVPFRSVLLDHMSGSSGGLGHGASVNALVTDYANGSLVRTGNTYDIALTGDAYLAVRTPQGLRYTRDGSLTMAKDGTLIQIGSGALVMDVNNKPIKIPQSAKSIVISPDGQISADNAPIAKLALVGIDTTSGTDRLGDNALIASNPHMPSKDSTVQQGYIEASNVNTVKEMISMITVMRAYETNMKMLQSEDTITGKAINEVAKV